MLVVEAKEAALLLLYFGEKPAPAHNVVLILVIEDHLRVHKVLYDLFSSAVLQEFGPRCLYAHALFVVVRQGVHMQVVAWPHVDIEAGTGEAQHEDEHCVHSVSDDGALAKSEVPDLKIRSELRQSQSKVHLPSR